MNTQTIDFPTFRKNIFAKIKPLKKFLIKIITNNFYSLLRIRILNKIVDGGFSHSPGSTGSGHFMLTNILKFAKPF